MNISKEFEDLINYKEACSLLNFKTESGYREKNLKVLEMFACEKDSKYFSKIKIEKFNNEYTQMKIFIEEINDISGKDLSQSIPNVLKSLEIELLKFGKSHTYNFIHNKDVFRARQYYMHHYKHPNCLLLTKVELMKEIESQVSVIDDVLEEYNITPFIKGRCSYYLKSDVEFLKEEQTKLMKHIVEKYTTTAKIQELTGESMNNVNRFIRANNLTDKTIKVPPICRISSSPYKSCLRIIPKHLINMYIEDVKRKKVIRELLMTSETEPFQTFLRLLKALKIVFPIERNETKTLWENYIRTKLESTVTTGNRLEEFILLCVHTTELLIRVTSHKDIFNFSIKEITLALMNENVPNNWQKLYFSFFHNLSSTFKEQGIRIFDARLIKNPKLKIKARKEKETYSVEEYINLIDYSKKALHKDKALIDAKEQVSGVKHGSYAQMWLYVITQLNNVWNHVDIVSLPRLNLNLIDNITLDWLKQNDITKEQADIIVDYYRCASYERKKTGKELKFIISDELILDFATSIIICELIQRELYPLSGRLIDFNNKENAPSKRTIRYFFESYEPITEDFQFSNLVLNRTVLSSAIDVIKKITNRNSLDIIKYFRNHSNVETTNIYIDVPLEHINYIANHLFKIGNFGYLFDNLALLLGGESEDREQRVNNSLVVKNTLGSIDLVEKIANCAMAIASERNAVKDIIAKLSPQEISEQYNLLNLGLLPSKEEDMQCLVGMSNCPMGSRKCVTCHLMIPNRFTLIKLNSMLNDKMNAFMNCYFSTSYAGDKKRVANQLYIYLELTKQAIEKFGRDTVERFVNLDDINQKLSTIPTFKEDVTLIQ